MGALYLAKVKMTDKPAEDFWAPTVLEVTLADQGPFVVWGFHMKCQRGSL